MEFKEIVKKRYSSKKFTGAIIPDKKVDALLEMIRLSATSYGLQPFKVIIVKNQETKEKLQEVSFNQPQVGSASHVLVFCAYTEIDERINKYEQLMRENGVEDEKIQAYVGIMRGTFSNKTDEEKLIWAQKQTYIAMSNVINGAVELGFDSCPMEGFIPSEYSKILKLKSNLVPTVVVPIGIAADKPREKIRYSNKDLFIEK